MRVLLAAALVLLATAAGGGAALTRSVYVDGDSLAEGTAPYLPALLPHWSLRQSYASRSPGRASGSRSSGPSSRASSRSSSSASARTTTRAASRTFRTGLREILAIAGPSRCVVWTNIVRPPAAGTSYDGLNRALSAAAATHRNLVVVDWRALVRSHPGWLRADGVHATAAGYKGRAAAIAAAVKECSARIG